MVIFGPCPLVGPPFLWGPVRPNMLNMPKSASEDAGIEALACARHFTTSTSTTAQLCAL